MPERAEVALEPLSAIIVTETFGEKSPAGNTKDSRFVRTGVIGVILMFLGLAVLSGLAVEPLRPRDEASHVEYAISLAHGTIPRTSQHMTSHIVDQRRIRTYTANHPPLFYLVIAGPLVAGIAIDHPVFGLHLARVECAILSAITIAVTAWLAGLLTERRRREVQITAAAVLGTIGAYVYSSSLVFNDALATLLSALVLTGTVVILKRGSQPRVCWLVVLASAAAITARASCAEVVMLAGAGFVVAGIAHADRRGRGALRGLGWAAVTGLGCLASAGWFYLLNQSRYGNTTGHTGLPHESKSFIGYVMSPSSYRQLIEDTYGDLSGVDRIFPWSQPLTTTSLAVIWAVVGAGALWTLSRRSGRAWFRRNLLIIALLAVHCIATICYIGWWVHTGGAAHTRYLFPALPVIAIAIAAAVLSLPFGRILAALLITLQLGLSVIFLAKVPAQWAGHDDWSTYSSALHNAGVPFPVAATVLLLLVVLIGWAMCLRGLLAKRAAERW